MEEILILGGSLVFVLVFIWGARTFYYRKPRRFTGHDGRKWTWHPGGSYSDPQGRKVTDPAMIAKCEAAWAELHERTARETAAIQSGRLLGD